jgi:hypothetical protein
MMTDHEAFVALSCALTGMKESELPVMVDQQDATGTSVKLYEVYIERLRAAYPAELKELMATWLSIQDAPDPAAALAGKLTVAGTTGDKLRMGARQVIKIWFLSTIDDPRLALDPKGKSSGQLAGDLGQYQHSAIWKLIGAPVPGYSNSPHGYWKDKPTLP